MSHTWSSVLAGEKQKPYFQSILNFLENERIKGKTIYPAPQHIFNALKYTPYASIKVVILGQDPYHGARQAHGLAFSVPENIALPPSLQNIFKELHADLGCSCSLNGSLEKWARQGVLLLNAVLTVEAGNPQSHAHIGWQQFTDAVIMHLNEHPDGIVFLLWGAYAQRKKQLLTHEHHYILEASHPSPLSAHRGFLGCRHFSKANAWLKKTGREPIDWCQT